MQGRFVTLPETGGQNPAVAPPGPRDSPGSSGPNSPRIDPLTSTEIEPGKGLRILKIPEVPYP